MRKSREMQGEGNYDAARRFNTKQRQFVESGKVEQAAADAAPRSKTEAAELIKAEEAGREKVRTVAKRKPAPKSVKGRSR